MLAKKIRLERALKNEEVFSVVKECFIEYQEAYKRLRNPQKHHDKDYENLYTQFDAYEKKHKGDLK